MPTTGIIEENSALPPSSPATLLETNTTTPDTHFLAERMIDKVHGVAVSVSSKVADDNGGRTEFSSMILVVGMFASSNGA